MAKKSNLPAAVHDHFRKANILHTYVQKELGEAAKHALEIGIHLLAAKKAVPHGSWEPECERLFDGSPRTARFYMAFTRDFGKLKTAEKSAVLMLEGTLDGAAKAAKRAANPKTNPEPTAEPREPTESSGDSGELESCPGCGGTDFFPDGVCRACVPETVSGAEADRIIDAASEPVFEPSDSEPTEETPEEPEDAESAGTWLKSHLLGVIMQWKQKYPDAPECLVGSIWETITEERRQ